MFALFFKNKLSKLLKLKQLETALKSQRVLSHLLLEVFYFHLQLLAWAQLCAISNRNNPSVDIVSFDQLSFCSTKGQYS